MFCPKTNGTCQYRECPLYLQDYCLDVLRVKASLNILSQEEKQALATMRKATKKEE